MGVSGPSLLIESTDSMIFTMSAACFACTILLAYDVVLYRHICDRLHENPPYGINAQFTQCAFLVPKVETYQISFFVIFMS